MGDYEKHGRKGGRPQRELYKPGSGPLRKSGRLDDEIGVDGGRRPLNRPARSEEIEKITEELKKIKMYSSNPKPETNQGSDVKKPRKPYEFYQAMQSTMKEHDKQDNQESGNKPFSSGINRQGDKNNPILVTDCERRNLGTSLENHASEKSRRRSEGKKRRKGKGGGGREDSNLAEERLSSLVQEIKCKADNKSERLDADKNRLLRHGSEPRSVPVTIQDNRNRDTKSVEPNSCRLQDKGYNKPPPSHQVRKGNGAKSTSKLLPPSFDTLPPRFQKKIMAENGIQEPISSLEEGWDRSNITRPSIQGTDMSSRNQYQGTSGVSNKPPLPLMHQQVPPPPVWSQTLPSGRGRGRLRSEPDNTAKPERFSRSLTPEMVKKSSYLDKLTFDRVCEKQVSGDESSNIGQSHNSDYTSHEEKENWRSENRHNSPTRWSRNDSGWRGREEVRSRRTPVAEQQHSKQEPEKVPVSPVKEDGPIIQTENVETTDVLDWAAEVERSEQLEGMGMSHADSHESFVEPAPPPSRDRRKRRKRSLSRENSGRNALRRGSVDNISSQSRNNSPDRKWGRDRRSRKNSGGDRSSRQSSVEKQNIHFTNPRFRNSSSERRFRDGGRFRSRERRTSERQVEETNWRLEKRLETPGEVKQAGIIVLPQNVPREELNKGSGSLPADNQRNQRQLYNPNNPGKPITVAASRVTPDEETKYGYQQYPNDLANIMPAITDQFAAPRPVWYNPYTDSFMSSRNQQVIRTMEQADCELQYIISTSAIIQYWDRMQHLRSLLKDALKRLLLTDLRFCQAENVEQHLWKILYYNIIELLRKFMNDHPDSKDKYKGILLGIIDEGTEYFEGLLENLETTNKVKFEQFLSSPICPREGLGYTGLALVAAQKLFLFLGDLARYKEQANESNSYGLARQWYMKAHQINPKNGRPYNQLALLAMYMRRRLDAVYYFMRSLMASNPLITARDSLLSLFDENRKKYEITERKRKEERALREREKMKEKESGGGLRREIWIHPGGGKNIHRTTSASHQPDYDSEDQELYSQTNIEVNKRFGMSYLHVHGKFFTKIGQETLTETAIQMLKEFRALLQHSPIPLNSTRFLQLLALNMFSIEITQPKDINQMEPGYRPALQESALVVSLQMFNLMLERFIQVLKEHIASPEPPCPYIVPSDCLALLPAIKVWCDWLMTHVEVWNPPPSCQDYKVGPPGDCWNRLATLVTLLEKIDYRRNLLSTQEAEGFELVYLPEDATLCGFTPLMANAQEPVYTSKDTDMELAQVSLRVHKVLFFGSVFLCGLDPPVLKVHKLETGVSEYVSVVDTPSSQEQSDADVCIESESSTDGESEDSGKATGLEEEEGERGGEHSGDLKSLIIRKGELERVHRRHLKRHKHVQKILSQQAVVLEMEVRPHYLVPDTNCFIDYLQQLQIITRATTPHSQQPYIIMVPLVVVNELNGLSQGCKPSQSATHAALVRESARIAMTFIQTKHLALRCVTTKGTVLSSTTFIFEEDTDQEMKNDDKILTTCLNLGQLYGKDDKCMSASPRRIVRNVVLLTEDRNLRVKALARDVPVRELPDFFRWAGLG